MTWTHRFTTAALVAGVLVLGAGVAEAKQTPEQKCQKARYEAAAKYAACQQKAMGKFYGGGEYEKFRNAIGNCTTKYTATWPKLQKKAAGTGATCDTARFADNGDGTVTDWLTGLQWEQKTDDATIHDKDNVYSWTATPPFTAANGTAFTSFLAPLNGGGCFAGQCDWRLPTVAELQTILLAPYPCTTSPCVDEGLFGPTVAIGYWSATANADLPGFAWVVNFNDGDVVNINKDGADYVRAVRSGP